MEPYAWLRSKFRGCLLGLALGDALGAPFEGRAAVSKAEVRTAVANREVLRYTDDTHMAVGAAESLIACRGFDARHMINTWVHNYEREPWRGYGLTAPRVFEMVKAGLPWDRAAETVGVGGSSTNGAAMRVAPIGLFYHRCPARLREVALSASSLTHAHPSGREGALIQAQAVALALLLGPRASPDEFLDRLMGLTTHREFRDRLRMVRELVSAGNKEELVARLGNGVEALRSVPTAVCCFLRNPHCFERAVVEAVSLGGDADTIAAMTGAISGAWLGNEGLPEAWVKKLENREYLELLAEALWQAATAQGD